MPADLEEYTLDGYKLDELGELDPPRKLISRAVVDTVKRGNWFSFCTKSHKDQVDIMSIENNMGKKMGSIIGDIYFPDTEYRSAIYKHFLKCYMCYYEVPIVKKSYDSDAYKNGFEKWLITSNVAVIAAWLDIEVGEVVKLYAMHLDDAFFDDGGDEMPYVRLYTTKDGIRKVRKPRVKLDLSKRGTRILPVFAIKLGIDMLHTRWSKEVVEVSFQKDAGDTRVLDVSTSPDIIRNIYGESDFYYKSLNNMYEGDFLKDQSMQYGYLRLPEIGGSKYDTPLRSLSFARIIHVKYDVEPNLLFVNIDMDSIVEEFKGGINTSYKKYNRVAENLVMFELMSDEEKGKLASPIDLEAWVDLKVASLGTTFLRSLALFMLANPTDFPDYTGEPKQYSDIAKSFGLDDDDEIIV